ncbi:site-specific integrase [Streptomyces sp. ISL-100]|uniref:tyrosine-type recombinase/integrase n=1 Tax=Streptomyces sp. ISL-100 TaxID=2819173 RepID=UPI001BE8D929|nr:site-specific integrase [Streptomyces sp. ISL-100]MBT2401267.1 tyrosine-type recombinase/integrase [Streptomyces sp. ISL-100]
MAAVVDRWHLARPKRDATPCAEHNSKARTLVPSADHGKGTRWQVRYRDVKGQQKKENFARKPDADARAAAVETDLNRGEFVDRKAGQETFRAAAERWRASAVHRPSTAASVRQRLETHVYPSIGDRPIAQIRPSEMQAWIKGRSSVLAPVSLRNTYAIIVTVMRSAVLDGVIRSSPCDGVKLPSRRRAEVVPPSDVAVRALIEAAPTMRERALVLLAAASGMRQGELFGLEVGHIDFLRREVRVQQQLVCVTGKGAEGVYLGPPKTHEATRTVPLAKAAVEAVAMYLAHCPAVEVEVWDRRDSRRPVQRKARLLFPNAAGRPFQRSPWARTWSAIVGEANAALEAAGSGVRVPAGTTLHDLRHYYASLLIKHRESVKTVQKRLGHSKPSITLDTYCHMWLDDEDTTRAAVEAALGDVPPMCPERKAG